MANYATMRFLQISTQTNYTADTMKRNLSVICLALCCLFSLAVLGACVPPQPEPPNKPTQSTAGWGIFTEADFIKANGTVLRKNSGSGDPITLRGVNAGGLYVTEQWMSPVRGTNGGYTDHKDVTNLFVERFGAEGAVDLWEYYRQNFWTEDDFRICQEMGMNSIRLPFTYMTLDPDYNNVARIEGEKYNFNELDWFVETAANYGIYTILDMHGAYGSQNGQDHSGESLYREQVDFYTNEENKNKTTEMWKAIAEHYKGNPAVAGYDLLNEPGEKAESTRKYHWDYFDVLYDAIRSVDEDHVIIMESCWDGNNLPQPRDYNWQNVMYSFHNYTSQYEVAGHMQHMRNKLNGVHAQNFGVPVHMGEFTAYNNEESWKQTMELFNAYGWSWHNWFYKISGPNARRYGGWGIFVSTCDNVQAQTDDWDTILDKWYRIDTAHEDFQMYTFESGNTLYAVLQRGYTETPNYEALQ